jgi:hypothetical protein
MAAAAPFMIPDLPSSKVPKKKKSETLKTMKPWRLSKIEGSILKVWSSSSSSLAHPKKEVVSIYELLKD